MVEQWVFGGEKAHVWRPYCDGYWFNGYKSLCGLIEGNFTFIYSRIRPYGGWQKRCKKCSRTLKNRESATN